MDLPSVAVFVEAVQAGSIASAARRLGLSPLTATRRLSALEADVGARLMHRTTRALTLTAEGESFLPFAEAMLEKEAEGRSSVRPAGAGAFGLLRVTASVAFGRKIVAPVVGEFLRANPLVRVDLHLTDTQVDLVAQGIDLAIRIARLKDSGLIARRLATNARNLYASPAYLAEHGAPAMLRELASHECLAITGSTHWSLLSEGRSVRTPIHTRFTANAVEALHQLCLAGLGIAMLSAWDVQQEVKDGRLVSIELADAAAEPLVIWAVHPSARFVAPKVRMFADAMEKALRSTGSVAGA